MILLHRIDNSQNMARFYLVMVDLSLFGEWMVLRQWGRIGSRGQQRVELVEGLVAAQRRSQEIVAVKKRRGYVDVSLPAAEGSPGATLYDHTAIHV